MADCHGAARLIDHTALDLRGALREHLLKGVQLTGFQFQYIPADEFDRNERELRELLASGRVKPHAGVVFSLDDIAAALRHVRDGRAIGKVLIDLR